MSTENTHFGAEAIDRFLSKDSCKRIFFCGVGGVNMSSLAHVTLEQGYSVSGSDRQRSPATEKLTEEGAEIFYCHDGKNVDGSDAFVYTVAISPDNPEYVRAGELNIPRISRADYLGYLMTKFKNRLGVCGTHGKSTTTAMCASIFEAADRDPSVMCGAKLKSCGSAYRRGSMNDLIFEACEYMDSFLDFNPTSVLILNVELDHVDYFHSMEQVRNSYGSFAALTGDNGTVICNADDPEAMLSVSNCKGRLLTFGVDSTDADVRAEALSERNGAYSFDLVYKGEALTRIELRAAGRHILSDALGAAAAALAHGIDPKSIAKGLAEFSGIGRRMEFKGILNGARVYDDYAHHPTEVAASLSAARKASDGRLICLFQSHTFSRTHALQKELGEALSIADVTLVAPIYPAREENLWGVSQHTLADAVKNGAIPCDSFEDCATKLTEMAKNGDAVIVMGAGDIEKVFGMLKLCEK